MGDIVRSIDESRIESRRISTKPSDESRRQSTERRNDEETRREHRDSERRIDSNDFRDDLSFKMTTLEPLSYKPQWNFIVDSKEILSQFLLGGIAMAMMFKGHSTSKVA